jgi:hypothetical protein
MELRRPCDVGRDVHTPESGVVALRERAVPTEICSATAYKLSMTN